MQCRKRIQLDFLSILPEITSENLRRGFRVAFNYYITMYRKKRALLAKQPSCTINRKMEGQEFIIIDRFLKMRNKELVLLKYWLLSIIVCRDCVDFRNYLLKMFAKKKNCSVSHTSKIKKNWRNRSGFKKVFVESEKKTIYRDWCHITVVSFAVLFVGFGGNG